jgi:hypothetical protein
MEDTSAGYPEVKAGLMKEWAEHQHCRAALP